MSESRVVLARIRSRALIAMIALALVAIAYWMYATPPIHSPHRDSKLATRPAGAPATEPAEAPGTDPANELVTEPSPTARAVPPPRPPDPEGVPPSLILVPRGTVHVGSDTDEILALVEQTAPRKPTQQAKDLSNVMSELGKAKLEVRPFFLARTPVTNAQYLVYVKKTGNRFPYHWWRRGEEKHYNSKLKQIRVAFPDDRFASQHYWERHHKDLPYKLVDDKGQSIANYPVVNVSWRDAMRYAAWLGMRLPTELEWTYAARGTGTHTWLWGGDNREGIGDVWVEKVLDLLGLRWFRGQHLRDVIAIAFATGPFGHADMVGQVWEWTGERGFGPLSGSEAFVAEFDKLQSNEKFARLARRYPALLAPPLWKAGNVVVKGGSYFSWQNPVQLHIDARTSLQTTETLDGVGFRLAKSLEPGRDMLVSWVRADYNVQHFMGKQEVNLGAQIGVEHYDLTQDGFVEAYSALSFAPVNFLSQQKDLLWNKIEEQSLKSPLVVGTLAITVPLKDPALEPGIYTVFWRGKGMTEELKEAIRLGHRAVQADLRDPRGDVRQEAAPWRAVLKRFGLTGRDLEDENAPTSLEMIRLKPNTFEISTANAMFLFADNSGAFVAAIETRVSPEAATGNGGSSLKLDTDANGLERLTVTFAARNDLESAHTEFVLPLVLATAPAPGGEFWRGR